MKYVPIDQTPASWYEEIGLRAGLKIHQQLLTDKKLFCRCPAGIYSKDWDAEILRHMRPTLSELGDYDGTALMEFKTRKQIVYLINKETVCTYEFDDTPPFQINENALDIALEVALLLNLNIVSELHIARKQYLDGSIPTGFQRTTILGVDGWIPFRGRRIRIQQLGLEEDACREVSDVGHERTYLTDRLGMPLIEPVTYPDMSTPDEVAGVADVIRWMTRCTGKVRTGPGAARQDVNVSVRGGRRCEIKGVPSIKRIPALVHNEAIRQLALLEIRDELKRRRFREDNFEWGSADVTDRLAQTRFWPVRQAVSEGRLVHCILLRGFEGLLRHPTGPGKNFLQEISDRVRVVACIDMLPNIVSTDLPEGNFSPREWKTVRRAAGACSGDAVVVVWGKPEDVETACKEVAVRAKEACRGVPSETRQAMPDGTTGFERILPGPNRMYPDTDLPPKPLSEDRVKKVRALLPEPPWRRNERYLSAGVPEQVAGRLSISRYAGLFDRLVEAAGADVTFVAVLVTDRFRVYGRRGLDPDRLSEAFLRRALHRLTAGRIVRDGLLCIVERALGGDNGTVDEIIDRFGLRPASRGEIEAAVQEAFSESLGQRFCTPKAEWRFVMGRAMGRLRGRAEGAAVAQTVEDAVAMEVSA
jgi:glutamyl-tRNA(Gln) amidotransferase subunit E